MVAAPAFAARVTVISYLPTYPVPDKPIAIRIDDVSSGTGNVVGPHTIRVVGNTIRIEGCVGTSTNGNIPEFGPYTATVTLPPLPIGDYQVQYFRSADPAHPDCAIGVGFPLEFRGSTPLRVSAASSGWPPAPGPVAAAYQYIHDVFGYHYFMSIDEDEKLAIESGRFTGWRRYGPLPYWTATEGFGLFTSAAFDRVPLCRFFSDAFAPKSTHFYTANAAECDSVKENPIWQFEGIVAYAWPVRTDGSCAQGRPLYRLYNNGQSGAPNHVYTEDEQLRNSLANSGWIPEGVGRGVIACVPGRPVM